MKLSAFRLLILLLATITTHGLLMAQKKSRVALIIGNSNYEMAPLRTSVNDAKMMEETLKQLGFQTIIITDATQNQMKQKIREFGNRLADAKGVGFFYYSGHSIQLNGENYLIPVSAQINEELDVELECVDLKRLFSEISYANNEFNIVVLDASRNNPFGRSFRSTRPGLAPIKAPSGTIISIASSPGSVASDGNGTESFYTSVLSRELLKEQRIEEVFKHTRTEVYKLSNKNQIPWETSSLYADYSLADRKADLNIPKFPWPPPKASAIQVIPSSVFSNCRNYFEVDEVLDIALTKNGYYDKSYYVIVPSDSIRGFAIATKLEQINKDATSKSPPNRWQTKVEMNDFTFSEYLSSLFFTQIGYFRVIVFIVTDVPITMQSQGVDRDIAVSWVEGGAHIMPPVLRDISFTKNYSVTALIYEYELPENSNNAKLNKPGKHSGREHLVKSKLWGALIK